MWVTGREWPWQVSGTYCLGTSVAIMTGGDGWSRRRWAVDGYAKITRGLSNKECRRRRGKDSKRGEIVAVVNALS